MEKQRTIKNSAGVSGIALHTGERAHLKFCPAGENTGIMFIRKDIPGFPSVSGNVMNVVDVKRGTTIASGGAKVHTVEHVMAALHAASIDNAIVEMDGAEPPILDGSAMPYLELLFSAGIVEQNAPALSITLKEPVLIEEGETRIVAYPADKLHITCIVSYGATPLDAQFYSGEITMNVFRDEIAPARTFCIYNELEKLIAYGLAKGGSLDNAVVLHDGAIICKEETRGDKEIVCHKVLDIIGDLYLAGARVKAGIIAVKPGHPTNILLVKKMISQYEALNIAV